MPTLVRERATALRSRLGRLPLWPVLTMTTKASVVAYSNVLRIRIIHIYLENPNNNSYLAACEKIIIRIVKLRLDVFGYICTFFKLNIPKKTRSISIYFLFLMVP